MLAKEISFVLDLSTHRPFQPYPMLSAHRYERLRAHVVAAVALLGIAAAVLWLAIDVWWADIFLPGAPAHGPRGIAVRAGFAVILGWLWHIRKAWLRENLTIARDGESRMEKTWSYSKGLSTAAFAGALAAPLQGVAAALWQDNSFDADWAEISHTLLVLEIPALVFSVVSVAVFRWIEAVHRHYEHQELADYDTERELGTNQLTTS
ncbi:hypothetical protein L3Q65_00900 (plasmid) [Amycolatopsis sp. FU40]|uniref:hypothetical protein n=1 Tax=Amycolatopsis sp. FU40 TaxID=2914159 RepID=UPI001F2B2421|nr:hypothetical protein [Amycolatopsis sp. FU40]UKD50883.1 hypothetical protein L3Q65_00900 [Amycolatopsis sp. FU40]